MLKNDLGEFTSEQLLTELVARNEPVDGPKQVTFHTPTREVSVAIGSDRAAYLYLDDRDIEKARELSEAE